jgi:UDP-N-acetylmuramyl pentapeptide phosphotransferase/UDP-N-acetylglucosamine-1-phosphate transferase
VPITLLFVPMADVVRVTLYRLIHHKPLFAADKNHIHHKLMRSGMSQYQALLTILGLAVAYAAINFGLYTLLNFTWIIVVDVLIYSLVNVCINQMKIVWHETVS